MRIQSNMIQSKLFFLTVMSLFACTCLHAQQNPTPELLLGTWVFNESASLEHMPPHINANLQTSVDLQQHVATFYVGRQMQFASDGTFTIAFANGQVFSGQWSLEGNLLTTVTTEGAAATQAIAFPDAQNFYLMAQQYSDPNAELMFPELYFVKN